MLYMKKNFKIKGKIICEQKDFVSIFIFFSPLDDSNVTHGVYFNNALSNFFFLSHFIWKVIYNSECYI